MQSLQNQASNVVSQAEVAVRHFEYLPQHLESAKRWTQQAVSAYRDRAFSPFWCSMEEAYKQIGGYRDRVDAIKVLSRQHATMVERLGEQGFDISDIAMFPVTLDVERVQSTLDEATDNLNRLAYTAQCEPTFAMIWEQRRTTAAVVTGFGNLEAAVHGMRAAVTSSLHAMAQALDEGTRQTQHSLSSMSSSITGTLTSSHTEQIRTLKHLSHRSDEIRNELHHQTWGHYPLL